MGRQLLRKRTRRNGGEQQAPQDIPLDYPVKGTGGPQGPPPTDYSDTPGPAPVAKGRLGALSTSPRGRFVRFSRGRGPAARPEAGRRSHSRFRGRRRELDAPAAGCSRAEARRAITESGSRAHHDGPPDRMSPAITPSYDRRHGAGSPRAGSSLHGHDDDRSRGSDPRSPRADAAPLFRARGAGTRHLLRR
jgi:hypothetical protein